MRGAVALIESDAADGDRVVTVRGEIDIGSTPALRDWLARASDGGRRSVTVDLRGVRFLAVSGLYVLCDEQQRMLAHRARLTVVCTDRRIRQLFDVCRLDGALHVVSERPTDPNAPWSDEDDARAARLAEWLRRHAAVSA
jgi:anti-anti-sigma factor